MYGMTNIVAGIGRFKSKYKQGAFAPGKEIRLFSYVSVDKRQRHNMAFCGGVRNFGPKSTELRVLLVSEEVHRPHPRTKKASSESHPVLILRESIFKYE
jgi:hypothetical protein